jgi:hypothetical protein
MRTTASAPEPAGTMTTSASTTTQARSSGPGPRGARGLADRQTRGAGILGHVAPCGMTFRARGFLELAAGFRQVAHLFFERISPGGQLG